jgi:YebC/PmpR family DNA-binding regulatory protein
MSGHSHWAGIKHKKGIADTKRGMTFSKIARILSVAAKDGTDPTMNSKLRIAIEQARAVNMPSENVERAIKRGTGELGSGKLEEFLFEAFGPGKVAIMIEGITDNKNRALNEVKRILSQYGGKLAAAGSVKWLFDRKGVMIISLDDNKDITKENLELKAIESEAEDVLWRDNSLDIYTKPEELEKVKKEIETRGIKTESASLDWVAKEVISITDKDKIAYQELFEALDENEDVQEIYSNLSD